jgi:hypothetical protein
LGGCQVAFIFAIFCALKKLKQLFVVLTIINMLIGTKLSHKKKKLLKGDNIEKFVNEISRRNVL